MHANNHFWFGNKCKAVRKDGETLGINHTEKGIDRNFRDEWLHMWGEWKEINRRNHDL